MKFLSHSVENFQKKTRSIEMLYAKKDNGNCTLKNIYCILMKFSNFVHKFQLQEKPYLGLKKKFCVKHINSH